MSVQSWNSAATSLLEAADVLFESAPLHWLESFSRPLIANPWTAFESLLGLAAHVGGDAHAQAGGYTISAGMTNATQPGARFVPARTSAPVSREVSRAREPDAVPGGTTTTGGTGIQPGDGSQARPSFPTPAARPSAASDAVSGTSASASRPTRVVAKGGAILSSVESPPLAFAAELTTVSDGNPDLSKPTPAMRSRPELPIPAGVSAEIPSLDRTPRMAAGTQGPQNSAASASFGVTRLVSGLPAIKGLLQSAVQESRIAQDIAPMPKPAGALPVLDALAEDILVDKVADRLEERLREQALRHFGFTGGLI